MKIWKSYIDFAILVRIQTCFEKPLKSANKLRKRKPYFSKIKKNYILVSINSDGFLSSLPSI